MTENTTVRSTRCRGCFALGSQGTCNYIFIMEHRRPCPPGAQCTARMTRKELAMRKATWDTELGHKLWAEGKKDTEIASTLGIPTSTVTNYRLKHWAPAQKKTTAPKEVQPVAVSTEETPATETEDPPEDLTGNGPRVPVPETHAPAIRRQHAFRYPKRMLPPFGVSMMTRCLRSALRSWTCWRLQRSICPGSGQSVRPVRYSLCGSGGTRKISGAPVTQSTTC